jgi:putative transposase
LEEYERFTNRDLSCFNVEYLFLDAIYEPMRHYGNTREGILCAWGITRNGNRVLLHMGLGNKESYENWLEFLRDMVKRGLPTPVSITSDGAGGLIKVIDQMWNKSLHIKCWAHKKRNFLQKVASEELSEIRASLDAVMLAPDYATGQQAANKFIEKYEKIYPSAGCSFKDDLEASLAHLKMPEIHRKYVRTKKLIERSFEEERRRTKVIPRFFNEKSDLKLAFSVLWRERV